MRLLELIRAFQQHKLSSDRTSVHTDLSEPAASVHPDTSALKEAITTQLLNYRPRRLPKRGT
jgi:hypothetical protein